MTHDLFDGLPKAAAYATTNTAKTDKEWRWFMPPTTSSNCFDLRGENRKMKEEKMKIDIKDTMPSIEKVIFNEPATIILWGDKTKTVVKCKEDEYYDPHTGLAMAICKKVYGDKYGHTFRKWTKPYYESLEEVDEETNANYNLKRIEEIINKLSKI